MASCSDSFCYAVLAMAVCEERHSKIARTYADVDLVLLVWVHDGGSARCDVEG